VNPKTLDHVAYWLADRDAVADFALEFNALVADTRSSPAGGGAHTA